MPSKRSLISLSLPLLALSLASGCATPGAIHPPVADLKAVVEPKPVPSDDIATSQKAADDYSATLEGWGDRVSAAGGRICRWSERVYKIRIGCPAYTLPPADLLKPPAKTDFLSPTGSSPQSRPSSSTN